MNERLVRVDDIVGARVIADRLGFAHAQTVSLLRRRYADFPDPIVNLGVAHAWDWTEVETWARAHRPRSIAAWERMRNSGPFPAGE